MLICVTVCVNTVKIIVIFKSDRNKTTDRQKEQTTCKQNVTSPKQRTASTVIRKTACKWEVLEEFFCWNYSCDYESIVTKFLADTQAQTLGLQSKALPDEVFQTRCFSVRAVGACVVYGTTERSTRSRDVASLSHAHSHLLLISGLLHDHCP